MAILAVDGKDEERTYGSDSHRRQDVGALVLKASFTRASSRVHNRLTRNTVSSGRPSGRTSHALIRTYVSCKHPLPHT